MLDDKKLKLLKRLGVVGLTGVLMLFSYGLGSMGKNQKTEPIKNQTQQPKKEVKLTKEIVTDFLVAYYTKKDLEENRNRYESFLTESLYNQEIDNENQAISQAYKGYIVDFEFKDAEIYIDEDNLIALAKVKYSNTLLAKKGDYEDSQTLMNEATMKLTYTKEGNKFLISNKTPFIVQSTYEQGGTYPSYGELTAPEAAEVTEDKEEENGQEDDA